MAANRRASQALYRRLQRLCREVERDPGELSLLFGRPPRWYDPRRGSLVRAPLGKRPFVDNSIRDLSGGCTEFAYYSGGSSVSSAVRRQREFTDAMGTNYVEEATALLARLANAREAWAELVTLAESHGSRQAALESLPGVNRLPLESDASSKVANAGDWLLAHPVSCVSQPIFDRALILLDSVDDMPDGVRGVVVNKPLGATLRQLILRWPHAEDRAWAETLGPLLDLELGGGGPVVLESLQESMTWLHGHGAAVPGAKEIAPSLWVGGCLSTLSATVATTMGKDICETHSGNRAAAAGVWPFLGFSGWAALQLFNELERGVWVRARASTCSFSRFCFGSSSTPPADPIVAWQSLMSSVGLHHLAVFPRNGVIDQRLMRFLQAHQDRLASSAEDELELTPVPQDGSKTSKEEQHRTSKPAKSSARRRR